MTWRRRGHILSPVDQVVALLPEQVMIAHPLESARSAGTALQLALAFVRMVRNRRALRELDASRLDDCGITRDALERAVDWRFWRRIEALPVQPQTAAKPIEGPVTAAPAGA
jgi:uncharacterized protein YjiS (DUF1127 family)